MKRLLLVFSLGTVSVFSQSTSAGSAAKANPLSSVTRYMYATSKNEILKSAEEMPEENYAFKPVATVRTFGQLVGHVADAQYEFCSAVVGDGKQPPGIEKNKTSKADLIAALKEGFAYCDKAYDSMTDTQAPEIVKFFGRDSPKLSVLTINIGHNMEHYGNMVTYLRIKGLVPPSSQQQSMQ